MLIFDYCPTILCARVAEAMGTVLFPHFHCGINTTKMKLLLVHTRNYCTVSDVYSYRLYYGNFPCTQEIGIIDRYIRKVIIMGKRGRKRRGRRKSSANHGKRPNA